MATLRLLNRSKLLQTPDATRALLRAGLQEYLGSVCRIWGLTCPNILWVEDIIMDTPSRDSYLLEFVDGSNEVVYGSHTENAQEIIGQVEVGTILRNGGAFFEGPNSVFGALAHEGAELLCNPTTRDFVKGPTRPEGCFWAKEIVDWVEDAGEVATINSQSLWMPDFVTPAAFDPYGTGRVSYLRSITCPFTTTLGGYALISDGKNAKMIFGEKMPSWKRALKLRGRMRHHLAPSASP